MGSSPTTGTNKKGIASAVPFLFGTHEWDSKDERHRATVRWTVVTASDQAPAGARVEPRCLHHEKSTSSEVLFSMKRTLRCMKNEARLRPMKRGFAARRGAGASLHASAKSASREPQVSASRLPTANASLPIMLLSHVKSLRRRVDFISLSAEQKISQPRSGYFTFCTCKIFHLSLTLN